MCTAHTHKNVVCVVFMCVHSFDIHTISNKFELSCRAQVFQPNIEPYYCFAFSVSNIKGTLGDSRTRVRSRYDCKACALQLSWTAAENASQTKALTVSAKPMAQSVEFKSLTGLPEVQRLSETLLEDDSGASGILDFCAQHAFGENTQR